MARIASIVRANAREAVESLRKARLRTLLGLVGVMIGISSVIAMISLGEIAKAQARKEFEALGTDIMVLRKSHDQGSPGHPAGVLEWSHVERLSAEVDSIRLAAPRILGHGSFRYQGREVGNESIQGVTETFARINQLSAASGRFISDLDVGRFFCVVGSGIAARMREAGAGTAVGELLEVNEHVFTVVGVLDFHQESYALPFQLMANESVFVPMSTAERVLASPEIDVVVTRFDTDAGHDAATDEVQAYLHGKDPGLDVDAVSARQLIAQMESQMRIFTLLLAAVGSISLVVGGIGIMNIMLVSVVERRREIGLRRAIGARRRDIQGQFLVESAILTTAGGLLGVLLGLLATYAICRFIGWEFSISMFSVMSGIATATFMGLLFGFQPARQAAKLNPIEALAGD
ncbi:MAG: ABC transporter permease [Gammaproteobacteria bacterium]|nr:ABC transporter permease [Gammaproteobacteria bacterium]MYH91065.1 FtsX-like permease family protein [Gammaproteobacteria bacterium]